MHSSQCVYFVCVAEEMSCIFSLIQNNTKQKSEYFVLRYIYLKGKKSAEKSHGRDLQAKLGGAQL